MSPDSYRDEMLDVGYLGYQHHLRPVISRVPDLPTSGPDSPDSPDSYRDRDRDRVSGG